eukprot:gene26042-34640_t
MHRVNTDSVGCTIPCILHDPVNGDLNSYITIKVHVARQDVSNINLTDDKTGRNNDLVSVNVENIDDGISLQFSRIDGLKQLLVWVNSRNQVSLNRSFREPCSVSLSITADNRGKVVSFVNDFITSIAEGFCTSRIPAELFYSSSKRQKVSPKEEDNVLVEEQRIFKQFCLQDLAFECYDNLDMNRSRRCKVFSYESIQSGKRLFLVADMISFAKEYHKIPVQSRHAYEIIREGYHCRAYFDLEFHIPSNGHIASGDILTSRLINLLRWKILELYDAPIADSDILLLDSTTADKYSVHLTFHVRDYYGQQSRSQCRELLFENNIEVGKLLKEVVLDTTSPCGERGDTEHAGNVGDSTVEVFGELRSIYPVFEDFWVNKKDGKRTFFADLGVYTKNRAFRILGSCKYGKTTNLKVAAVDRFGFSRDSEKLMDSNPASSEKIMDSRIVYQDLWLQKLSTYFVLPCDVYSSDDVCQSELNQELYGLLPVIVERDPFGWGIGSCCLLPQFATLPGGGGDSTAFPGSGFRKAKALSAQVLARSMFKGQASMFPALDEYMTNVAASIGQVRGSLSSWELTATSHKDFPRLKLRYQVQHNRWCGNINRAHKSNGIFLDVELMSGEWTQSCFDVDCKGYKSPAATIPANVLPPTQDLLAIIQKHRASTIGSSFQQITT